MALWIWRRGRRDDARAAAIRPWATRPRHGRSTTYARPVTASGRETETTGDRLPWRRVCAARRGRRLGFPLSDAGRPNRRHRRESWRQLAVHGVPDSHLGRTVPQPGRLELDDQAGAGAHREPDDGRLVPRRVGG